MIFRWSIWGEKILENIDLLRYSVLSFRKQFGDKHQYIIYTDNFDLVSIKIGEIANIRSFPSSNGSNFNIYSKATWLKWCPSPRLDIDQAEFFIDSDVFLLKYPKEIDSFFLDKNKKFAVMDEFCGQPYQHGAMHKKSSADVPFINAGFFVQKKGFDISNDLKNEFDWWKKNIKQTEQTHHDEQGALAIALTKYLKNGSLVILPKEKYVIISETSNVGINNLDDIIMFHATYPAHPAFYKFKYVLDKIFLQLNK